MASPIVDIGLTAGAADTSQYFYVGDPVRGRIGTAKIAPPNLMTSYSDRVMGLSVQRTSSRVIGPIVEYNAGTATITLRDDDGALDPVNLSQSPVGADIRIRQVHDEVTYPVFRGTVTSWLPEQRSPTHAVVVVQAVDGFDELANKHLVLIGSPAGAGEDTGARVSRILDAANWPEADRNIAVGRSTLQGTTFDGNALDLAQKAVLAEGGELYVDAEGIVVFRDRHAVLTEPRSNTSQGTFGTGPGEMSYVGSLGVSNDRGMLANTVRASIVGGTVQSASDAASIARYRERITEEKDLLLQSDSEALSWAKFVLRQNSQPELRITAMTIDTRVHRDTYLPQALGRQLGDRITVVRRPPGVVDSRELLIRSIEHTWSTPDKWQTTWGLQPAGTFPFFTIGHPTAGRVGRNAIAF